MAPTSRDDRGRIDLSRAAVEVPVEPVTGARSRLTISVDFTGHGIAKILVPLMVRREARKDMPTNTADSSTKWKQAKPLRRAQNRKMADQEQEAAHWDAAYALGDDNRSWFEKHPDM
jgi:hypothetical protein